MVAEVPGAGGRWHQVHMNQDVMHRFFRLDPGADVEATFEHIDRKGRFAGARKRRLVYSEFSNKNPKIEFDLPDAGDYPEGELRPLLVILEVDVRHFRYVLLMPGDAGYAEMRALNRSLASVGKGLRRVITNLDEVEMRWPDCPLREPNVAVVQPA